VRRIALTFVLFALAAPAAARAQVPPVRARLVACHVGPDAADRTAAFTGSMPAVVGTKRMWMRFDLLARTATSDAFVPVRVPGLGVWKKSAPGRSGFIFTQKVQELAAPGDYEAVVRFRWYGAGGNLLRSDKRTTGICRQPDQRPDLRAGALTAAGAPGADTATYSLEVRNDGRSEAGPFDVGLTVAGVEQPSQRIAGGLAAGATRVVAFVAPRCAPGSILRFRLDAQAEVAEAAEADDVVARPCPFAE
jgi:hypothetical protein